MNKKYLYTKSYNNNMQYNFLKNIEFYHMFKFNMNEKNYVSTVYTLKSLILN